MYNSIIEIDVTYPNMDEARSVSKALFDDKVIACVSYSDVESEYVWGGELKREKEVLATYKTIYNNQAYIQDRILGLHSYEVPMIFVKTVNTNQEYMRWVINSVVSV